MKTLILYTSETGSTKQYAQWIKEAYSEYDLSPVDDFNPITLKNYDRIILCGWTKGGNIVVNDFLQANWDQLETKSVYLIVVGVFPENSFMSKLAYKQIPEEVRESLILYCKLPGVIKKDSTGFEKFMLRLFGGRLQTEVKKEDLDKVLTELKS